mgnify:CR=1 FL=1
MNRVIYKKFKAVMTGWDYEKYWTCRENLFNPKASRIVKLYSKYYISKVNRKQNADIAYDTFGKDNFKGRPILGHKLNGIIIAAGAVIGKNCFLSHQVTIGRSNGGAPVIGDNVYIGPGAKIFGDINVGDNVRIGANCIVFEDIPNNATVVLTKPKIIIKEEGYSYFVSVPDERIPEEQKRNCK